MERPPTRGGLGAAQRRPGCIASGRGGRTRTRRGGQIHAGPIGRRRLQRPAPEHAHPLGHRHPDRARRPVRGLRSSDRDRRHRQARSALAGGPGITEPGAGRSAARGRRCPRPRCPVGHVGLPIGIGRHRPDDRHRPRRRGARGHRGAVDRRSAGSDRRRAARRGDHAEGGRHVHRGATRRGAFGARLSRRSGTAVARRSDHPGRRRRGAGGAGLGSGGNPGAGRAIGRSRGVHGAPSVRRSSARRAQCRRCAGTTRRARQAAVAASVGSPHRPAAPGVAGEGQRRPPAGRRGRRRRAAGVAAGRPGAGRTTGLLCAGAVRRIGGAAGAGACPGVPGPWSGSRRGAGRGRLLRADRIGAHGLDAAASGQPVLDAQRAGAGHRVPPDHPQSGHGGGPAPYPRRAQRHLRDECGQCRARRQGRPRGAVLAVGR